MASLNPRKEAPITPGPPRFTSATFPDQTVDRPMSSTVITGMQSQSSFSKTTPSESGFYVPDNAEEFWTQSLRQAQKTVAYIQATVDANVKIPTYNLLVSGLEQKKNQQLLQKKAYWLQGHFHRRANFIPNHAGKRARAIDRVLTAELCEGNGGGELPDDEIHVGTLSLEEYLKIKSSVGEALSRVKCPLHTYVRRANEGWGGHVTYTLDH